MPVGASLVEVTAEFKEQTIPLNKKLVTFSRKCPRITE
jgi:hypothetical protein